MAFVSPDVTTPFETWSDPALPLWGATDQDGATARLTVVSGEGSVTQEGGALTVQSLADQCRLVPLDTVGQTLWSYIWRWTSPGNFCQALFLGSNWKLREFISGTPTDLSTATGTYSSGDVFEFYVHGSTAEVYQKTGGVWNETAVLFTSALTATSGKSCLYLGGTAWRIGDLLDVDTTAPSSGVTIYVNGSTGDDTRSRTTASNPATPVKSPQRAAALAQAAPTWADSIQIEPVVNAGAGDPFDASVYAPILHRIDNQSNGAPTLPFGNNSGNLPIVVRGHVVGGVKPAMAYPPTGRQLKGWQFEDLRLGYAVGSGHDVLTAGVLSRAGSLMWTRCDFTGGAYLASSWGALDTLKFVDCTIRSPLSPAKLSLDGMGFHLGYQADDGSGDDQAGTCWWEGCSFINIRGNDGIQCGLGLYNDPHARMIVRSCLFWDVTEGDPAYHTDAIQSLGGAYFEIRDSVFIGCSDAFIASDFRNGQIVIENNLIVGAGSQIQIQGTDDLIIRHNTIKPASDFGRDASIMFYTRQAGTLNRVTIVDNVYGGIFYDDEPARTHSVDSVIDRNMDLSSPGVSTGYGTNLEGIAEFGTSARMAGIPTTSVNFPAGLPADYELANTIPNSAIGSGVVLGDLLVDRLGRAYDAAPDVGCHQSSPGTLVTPVARAPYVVGRSPLPGAVGVAQGAMVEVDLYPLPGVAIDASTVTASSFFVTDPGGQHLPALARSVTGPDVDGVYRVVLDVDGLLYPFVVYGVTMTTAVTDANGSGLSSSLSWSFQVQGLGVPAVIGASGAGQGIWIGEHVL